MNITFLDPLGALLSLSATYYYTQGSKKAWPLSIVAIIINIYLYWGNGIYGQMGLEGIYFFMSLYGWYFWSTSSQQQKHAITNMPKIIFWIGLPIVVFSIYLCTALLMKYTESNIPVIDASVTVLGLCAQMMLCRKWIESWLLWLVVDIIIVFMHWIKGIPFHSATHFIYLILAILGYISWHKKIHPQEKHAFAGS